MSPRSATAVKRSSLPRGARDRAAIVVERLKDEYPAECALTHSSPWELLVATILSAQTTDERVNMVTPHLFAAHPTVHDLAGASLEEVEEIIRSTGFFRSKARAIVEMSQDVVSRYGGEVPPRMEDLVTLRGVGRKTANVVLGVAFGVPGFPVDTHVTRLTRRLGLTRSLDPVQIEKDVTSMVPPEEWTGLSLRLILHGRRCCTARAPQHHLCVLRDICPSADGDLPLKRKPRATGRTRVPPKAPSAAQ
ncbi:MAG TPA: endonuclease III [Candidatus Dormibacteraeota bacterium]|jgi:endonuclease-3|nr:endonuclease III [Candidatus Dormibacteraeota bacterium]